MRIEFVLFGGSVASAQAARFAYAVLVAGVLTKADFTVWALMLASLAYLPVLLGGVLNGLGRELPVMLGQKDAAAANRIEGGAWLITVAASGLVSIGGVAASVITEADGAVAFGIVGGLTLVYQTQQFALRSRLRFRRASLQQFVFGLALAGAGLTLLISQQLSLVAVLDMYGVSLLAATLVGGPPRPAWPKHDVVAEIRRLGRIGFPIMLAGVLFSLFISADRWLAAAILGAAEAAPYQLASVIASGLLIVPTVVSQQVYPRMAIAFGEGATTVDLAAMARRQGVTAAALVLPVAVAVALGAVLLVPIFLPSYAAAVQATLVLCVGLVVLALFTGYGNYLNVIGRQWRYLRAQLASIVVSVLLMAFLGRMIGLVGIAVAIAMGFVLYGVLVWSAASLSEPRIRDRNWRTGDE